MKAKLKTLFNVYGHNFLQIKLQLAEKNDIDIINDYLENIKQKLEEYNIYFPKKSYNAMKAVADKIVQLRALAANGVVGFVYGAKELASDCGTITDLIQDVLNEKTLGIIVESYTNDDQLEFIKNLIPPQGILFVQSDQKKDGYFSLKNKEIEEIFEKSLELKQIEDARIAQEKAQAEADKKAKLEAAKIAEEMAAKLEAAEKAKAELAEKAKAELAEKAKIANEGKNPKNNEIINIFKEAILNNPKDEISEKIKLIIEQIKNKENNNKMPDGALAPEEPAVPEAPKNAAVLAAYQKMLDKKAEKEQQKVKDKLMENPQKQADIKKKLAAILQAKKDAELAKQKQIAEEAKKSLEEQKLKLGNLFSVPAGGEYNGFKFNSSGMEDDNDEEALKALKDISDKRPKEKTELEKQLEEAKKKAEELQLKEIEEAKRAAAQKAKKEAELKKAQEAKRKEEVKVAADKAMELLSRVSNEAKIQKISVSL